MSVSTVGELVVAEVPVQAWVKLAVGGTKVPGHVPVVEAGP